MKQTTLDLLSADMRNYLEWILAHTEELKAKGYTSVAVEYSWLDDNEPKVYLRYETDGIYTEDVFANEVIEKLIF
ncbi:MAG: hypothetical protein ACI3T9_04510 [Romboutsia timonensis]